jgi:hypothetical protein
MTGNERWRAELSHRMRVIAIQDALDVLFADGEVVEVRIPEPKETWAVLSGYFDDHRALARELASRNSDAGVYITLNPCKPALLARCKNRLEAQKSKSATLTTDNDIERRHWLLIDCDPGIPKGISSSEEEKAAASALANKVRKWLRKKGWPEPVLADSGNGYHLLYRIDLPNNPGARDLLKQVLEALAAGFNTDQPNQPKIDPVVFNASRIVKAYGTMARKGENLPERPHRRSGLIDVPGNDFEPDDSIYVADDPVKVVPYEYLEELAASGAPRQTSSSSSASGGTGNGTGFDLEGFIARHLKARPPVAHDGGQKWALEECPFNPDHKDAAVFRRANNGAIWFHCFHESCKDYHWPDLREKFEPRGSASGAAAVDDNVWPEPKPIAGLPAVETLDPAIIPAAFREFCRDVANRMQVPLDFPYCAQAVTTSAVIGRRMIVQPKANDTQFRNIGNLWGAVVAPSGSKKSPVDDLVTEPVRDIEGQWRLDYEREKAEYEDKVAEYETELAAWKKSGGNKPEKPDKPRLRQLQVNDSTYEKVQVVMAENPAGIFHHRDELSGWFSVMDRPDRGGERGFYLTSWSGNSSYNVDRVGRGGDGIHVPHCCISLLGTLTPDRLKTYLVNRDQKQAELNDGLIQRLQVLVWPDPVGKYEHIDQLPRVSLVEKIQQVFGKILKLNPDTPTLWRWEDKAQKLYREWDEALQNQKIRHPDTRDELRSHLNKYDKLLCALALQDEVTLRILEGKPIAALSDPDDPYRSIRLEALQRAIKQCAYLESHARRAYFCMQSPELSAAWELAQKIRQKKLPDPFAAADVYRKHWSQLGSVNAAEAAIGVLVACHWLRPERPKDAKREGYGVRFRVNPRIWEGTAPGV